MIDTILASQISYCKLKTKVWVFAYLGTTTYNAQEIGGGARLPEGVIPVTDAHDEVLQVERSRIGLTLAIRN